MKKFITITLLIMFLVSYIFIEFKLKSNPIVRDNIANPIYTIGDISYSSSLKINKTIIKFGSMFFGLYPGGLAFSNIKDAKKYIKNNNLTENKWGIYLLSGDYKLDTENGFINKSMLVTKEAYRDK